MTRTVLNWLIIVDSLSQYAILYSVTSKIRVYRDLWTHPTTCSDTGTVVQTLYSTLNHFSDLVTNFKEPFYQEI